ncbi:MAG: DUF222 domain-containing protein [Acidimicrobiia bacterium]|nr:DUF222 domain-containing protein [Acidimicrobiia bacterium]
MVDTTTSIDSREQELAACERLIGRLRSHQMDLLRSLDADRVTALDGSRSLSDWASARLDVSHETARSLVAGARRLVEFPAVENRLSEGDITFDRALATADLARSGASDEVVEHSFGFDMAGVRRLAGRHRRLTRTSETAAFRDRHFSIQPSLDESVWKLWGTLPGFEGSIVEKALAERADSFPEPGGPRAPRSAARADALVSLAQDALTGDSNAGGGDPMVSVFVDAELAASSAGEVGAEIATGPRVGPNTLERILCEGRVQVIVTDGDWIPATSPATRTIPPATRRHVLVRDGGCVIDGCSSRYRLQPHHIRPRSEGGAHDAENLATLCWYHHHVAIHGEGYRLDTESPPHRRRLIHPRVHGTDPP